MKLIDGVHLINKEAVTENIISEKSIQILTAIAVILVIIGVVVSCIAINKYLLRCWRWKGIIIGAFIIVIGFIIMIGTYVYSNKTKIIGYKAYLSIDQSVNEDEVYNTYHIIGNEGSNYIVYIPIKECNYEE